MYNKVNNTIETIVCFSVCMYKTCVHSVYSDRLLKTDTRVIQIDTYACPIGVLTRVPPYVCPFQIRDMYFFSNGFAYKSVGRLKQA